MRPSHACFGLTWMMSVMWNWFVPNILFLCALRPRASALRRAQHAPPHPGICGFYAPFSRVLRPYL